MRARFNNHELVGDKEDFDSWDAQLRQNEDEALIFHLGYWLANQPEQIKYFWESSNWKAINELVGEQPQGLVQESITHIPCT